MKKRLLSLMLMVITVTLPTTLLAQATAGDEAAEPYAVLTDSNTVLTFYYDGQKAARNGMGVGPFSSTTARGWHSARETITSVVFDDSFANYDALTSMNMWFYGLANLTAVTGVSNLNTSNVTSLRSTFTGCSSLTSLDLSSLNTSKVKEMNFMFDGCSSLTDLKVGFSTESVTTMANMFLGCSSLTTLDLSTFNTASVKSSMDYMFSSCSALTTIYVSDLWTTANVTSGNEMFNACQNLVGGQGTTFSTSHRGLDYAHIDGGENNPGYFTEKVSYNDGDIFTAETVEGIMLKYRIISEADKTCQVGTMVDTDSWISSDIANAVDDPMVEGTITIPEYAKGYRVIKIGYEAFINCTQVTSIVIPNTVTEITTAAMAQSGLTAITIPSSVSSIHYDFLHNCSNLESIVVEEGNQVYDSRNSCNALIETATNKLMMGCKTSTVPNGIETIGTAAFILCKGLTAIELPNTVTRIETQAFNSSDLSSINLPPSLEYIGYSCFAGSNVTSFVIPANVKEIMLGAFNCNGLTSIVVEQGNQVYDSRDNCNAIIETATNTLFEGFSVTVIPNSVTAIGSSAFREVWGLHEITIPESVAAIGEHAFIHTYLEKVTSERPEPVEIPDNAFSDNCYEQATLYVPQSSIEAYSTTGGWKNFKSILAIVEGGTAEPYAVLSEDSLTVTFYYDDQKTSRGGMDINNSILDNSNSPYGTATSAVFDVSFDAYRPTSTACWFENCSSLATINGIEYLHTDDVTNMSWMFECCFNLEELDLSNFNTSNVTEMYGMFLSCQGLKSLNVSSFNTSKVVGMNQMFCGLSNLTNLDLSNFDTSNVRWMYAMFADCQNLTSLDISSFNSALVSNMGDLFSNCVKLKTIYVGDGWATTGVEENGDRVFDNCPSLVGGMGTVYDANRTDYTYAHIDGGASNPGYFTDINDSINICSDDNHPHLIDLGLSTGAKVMCRNLGAQNPEDAGDTYTWDEFMALNLDKGYRAFTENELSYIVLQCEHKLHELNGVKGQMITTKAGNSFFLPFGDYWSSEVHEDGKAFQMYVRENIVQWQRTEKSNKSYARLVFDETAIVPDTVITPTFSSEYYYYNTIKIETETPDAEIYYTMNGRMLEGESTNFSSSSLGRYSNWKAWGDNLKEAKAEEVYDNQNYRYNYVLKLTSRVDSVFESAQLGYRFDELLTKNDYYTVRFQARSESGEGKIEFYCQNDTLTKFRSVADTMLIGKEMAEYEFTLKIDNDSTNQIVLNFGSVADTYYIDNVLFGPVISDTINDLRTRYVEYIYPQEGITIKAVATKDGMEESKPAVYDYYYDGWMTMMDTHEMGKKVCDAAIGDPNVPLELVYETLKRMEDMFYRYYEQRFEVRFDDMEIMEANDEMRHFVYMIEDMKRGFTIDGVCYHAIDSTHAEVIAPLSYYEKYRGTLSIAKEVNYNNINFQVTKVVNDAFAGSQLTAIIWNPEFVLGDDVLATIDNPNLLIYVNDASVAPDRDNIIINGRAKNIVLTDTKEGNGNFYCPKEFEAEMISYTRNFQQQTEVGVSRGWESIALPFAVQTIMHEKQGLITPFGISASTKHFWLRRLGDSGLTQATAIEANIPYIISMPNDEVNYAEEFNLSGRVTFTAQEVTIPVTEPVTLALADSTIKMVPAFQSIGRASDVWAINVGEVRGQYFEGSVFERDYREVRPFEAYTVHTTDGSAPRFVPVMEISGTTGIEDVRGLMSDGRGDKWYDLNGRRLQQKPTQKGVYLNNGHKVIIR